MNKVLVEGLDGNYLAEIEVNIEGRGTLAFKESTLMLLALKRSCKKLEGIIFSGLEKQGISEKKQKEFLSLLEESLKK